MLCLGRPSIFAICVCRPRFSSHQTRSSAIPIETDIALWASGLLLLWRNVNDPCTRRRSCRALNSDDAGSARPLRHRFRTRQRASTRLARGSVAGVGKARGRSVPTGAPPAIACRPSPQFPSARRERGFAPRRLRNVRRAFDYAPIHHRWHAARGG